MKNGLKEKEKDSGTVRIVYRNVGIIIYISSNSNLSEGSDMWRRGVAQLNIKSCVLDVLI